MILFYLLNFIFGLVVGSFLNCLVYRLYHKKTILGRSFCPKCRQQIAWYDNIPILSFIILGGRCRHCRQSISWQYPIVELATGLLFAAVAFHYPLFVNHNSLYIVRDWLMIFALVFIFVYDLKYLLIEDIVILPVALVVFVLNLILKISVANLLAAAAVGAGFFLFQYVVTRGRGVGLGDFRIGILMGLFFGWPKILAAIFSAYIIGAIVALLLLLFKKTKMSARIPLGPFLAIGSLIIIFYGSKILNWYLSRF